MKKYSILLHDDWELRGDGSGNVAELQYLPSVFLMDLCEKLNINMTFMVDVAQQLSFIDYQQHPEVKIQRELWDNTVRLMKHRGFDVQLHLHPQWLNAKYVDKTFQLSNKWNIGIYGSTEQTDLVNKSVLYLNNLLLPVDSGYRVHSFKPGAWGIQPSKDILKTLSNAGIKIVLGVRKGLVIPDLGIDFGSLEQDSLPYHPLFEDITKVSPEKNDLLVLPLQYYKPGVITLFKLLSHKIKRKPNKKSIASSAGIGTHLKLGDQPFCYLKESFDATISRLDKLEANNIPVLIESHTKDFPGNYRNIEKFLNYIVDKYGDKLEFMDLTRFSNSYNE